MSDWHELCVRDGMRIPSIVVLALLVASCGFDPNSTGSFGLFGLGEGGELGGGDTGGDGGDFDRDDCKIEDEAIGRTDVTIALARSTVRVAIWREKGDSPGEYIGFTLDVGGEDVVFTVKAGGESYPASGDSWTHPLGEAGPDVSAISHIDLCENGMPDGDDGAGDDGAGDDGAGGDGAGDGDGGDTACPPGTEGCGGGDDAGGDSGTGDGGDGTGDGGGGTSCGAEICP